MPLARRHWAQIYPSGFVPQFQTTSNWANQLRPFAPEAGDISFEMAQDVLKAAQLLKTAKLDVFAGLDATQQDLITTRLVEAAHQLAASAAAVQPQKRLAWTDEMRRDVFGGIVSPTFANESSIAQLALYWASTSSYASDVLFEDAIAKSQTDYLFVLEGLQRDPLARALMLHWGENTAFLEPPNTELPENLSGITLYPAKNAHDEAQLAAACVLRHIEVGRIPVALAATDRALTRRIRAMLATQNVQVRDENGWILSTTRAAAKLMAYLKASAWNASTDSVLDFLKNSDAKIIGADELAVLEKAARKANRASWSSWVALIKQESTLESSFPRRRESMSATVDSRLRGNDGEGGNAELLAVTQKIETTRAGLQSPRILSAWLVALRTALENSGLLQVLQDDLAGVKALEVLHIHGQTQLTPTLPHSPDRWSLAEFTAWVNTALESTSYKPPYPDLAQVAILPMSQLLARPFAAAVLAGCDEARFDPSPMLPGQWSPTERLALGLITRDEQDAATRAAWHIALQTPVCDVLWRKSENTGEPVLPSSLVQSLQLKLKQNDQKGVDLEPRIQRSLEANPTPRPQPNGSQLPVTRLSASGYSKLRTCPYQFFALQQLGLKEDDELQETLDKREFGLWLHAVLSHFHEELKNSSEIDKNMDVAGVFVAYTAMLNIAKTEVTAAQNIPEDAFLPWEATWPKLRDGYVNWLIGHQAEGWTFDQAEVWRELSIGNFGLKLVGQLDRIDVQKDKAADGLRMVLDYKTESDSKTAKRLKEPLEDTQLAFYAALVGDEMLEAGYVNVNEKLSKTYVQPDIDHSRSALIEGILEDMQAISAGKPLPALGEGAACDYCAARGLCRKDFWGQDK
jgi:ATP-dependent helicase/nuclease subunit B